MPELDGFPFPPDAFLTAQEIVDRFKLVEIDMSSYTESLLPFRDSQSKSLASKLAKKKGSRAPLEPNQLAASFFWVN